MPNNAADDLKDTVTKTFVDPVKSALGVVDRAIPDWMPGVRGSKPTSTGSSTNATTTTNPKPTAKQLGWADTSSTDNKPKSTTPPSGAKPPKASAPPKYHKGTDYVPKTGPAILKKGEAVLKKDDADKYRDAKGKNMDKKSAMSSVADELGGKKETHKKEIHHIKTRKGKSGGYIHTHVHTKPEEHPDEEHVSPDQDSMVEHMMQHMGEPNPGEAEADAGQSGVPAAGAPPQAGAPAPSGVPGM